MDYKYNELEYAKKIYNEGFQSINHIPTELRLVATYMRRYLDYNPKQLRISLYDWCEKHIENYNKVIYYKIINKAINQAVKKNSTLVVLDCIKIYQQEMNYILNSPILTEDDSGIEYNCKKLMFSLLCQMKINKEIYKMKSDDDDTKRYGIYFKGGQKKYTALKKIAKLPEKVKINEDIIHTLYLSNLVTPLYGGLMRLDFMNDINNIELNGNDAIITVTEFDKIGWYFDLYNAEHKITLCEVCGTLFKNRTKNSNQKYCTNCAKQNPYYIPIETKIIKCIDCGEKFEVDACDTKTCRCDICQRSRDRERKREWKRRNKEKYLKK